MIENGVTRESKKILIVDDEENMRHTLCEIFSDEGYEVTAAATGEEAVAMCREDQFRLEAIKKLTPSAIAIMMTGLDKEFEAIAKEAVRHSAYTIIKKPLDIDHVLGLLNKLVGERLSGDLRKPTLDEDYEK